MRGSFRREGTYVYLWLIHVDIWQKTTKFCKAIILQLKIILKEVRHDLVTKQQQQITDDIEYLFKCTLPFVYLCWRKVHWNPLFFFFFLKKMFITYLLGCIGSWLW